MLNLNFDPFPTLRTQRLILRELTLKDAEEVFIQRSNPEINKYIHRTPALNSEEAIQFIQKITEQQKNKHSITWAITKNDSTKLIGSICLWNIDPLHNTAEVGYSIHPDFFKQGLMNESLIAVIKYGFGIMNAIRIDAFTNQKNIASLSLLARNGFERNTELELNLEDQTELTYNQIFSLKRNLD
jgi:ribosomal-protein-alanine N-acetyltransferase